MKFKLEVIGFDINGCIAAQNAGADRIELCASPSEGGTTPSYGLIKMARDILTIDLFPIIRPRGGDFMYNDEEFDVIKSEIKVCKVFGCNGIVIGMLNSDGGIDKERCKRLVELAYPLQVTFHRAFDRVANAEQALEDVIEIGCTRILTSGLKPTATEGADIIAALVKQANRRIIIMPGSGVRSDNMLELAKRTGATEFHTSARVLAKSKMNFVSESMNESLKSVAVDENEVAKIKSILASINN
ncbi:MAG: copper homeostasis protein CutC [Chitinophagaceae bacterium]|nr:copper homeostasis protein CutC [Chitinophagaceae bacterium]